MKKLLLLLTIFSYQASAIELDKITHFSVSYGLAATGMHLFPDNKTEVALLTIAVGLVKELSDERVDDGDLVANGVGVGLAAVVWSFD